SCTVARPEPMWTVDWWERFRSALTRRRVWRPAGTRTGSTGTGPRRRFPRKASTGTLARMVSVPLELLRVDPARGRRAGVGRDASVAEEALETSAGRA